MSLLHSFLWLDTIPLYGWTTFCLYPLPVEERVGCFDFLAIMNNTAVNIYVKVFVWTYVSISILTLLFVIVYILSL